MSLPDTGAPHGSSFHVEAFEDQDDIEATVWGTDELEDDGNSASQDTLSPSRLGSSSGAAAVFKASSLSDEAGVDVPVWGTGELEDLGMPQAASADEIEQAVVWGAGQLEALDAIPAQASLFDEVVGEPPAWGTGELEGLAVGEAPLPSASSFAGPAAAGFSRKLEEYGLLNSGDDDTRARSRKTCRRFWQVKKIIRVPQAVRRQLPQKNSRSK